MDLKDKKWPIEKEKSKALKTEWFVVKWGEGNSYPLPGIDSQINNFIENYKISMDDIIDIKYTATSAKNRDGKLFDTYTALLVYKK